MKPPLETDGLSGGRSSIFKIVVENINKLTVCGLFGQLISCYGYQKLSVSAVPAIGYDSSDAVLYIITACLKFCCYLRVQSFVDRCEISFVLQTELQCIAKISETIISGTDSELQ